MLSPFPKRQILDSSTLTELADGNFEFDENGEKFPERVENSVGNGEIARYEIMSNFSFSQRVFKRLLQRTRKNMHLFGKVSKCLL